MSPPQFFFARDQGKSHLRLPKARVEVTWINARHDIETHSPPFELRQPNSEAVGPMKPLQGPTQIAGRKWPDP